MAHHYECDFHAKAANRRSDFHRSASGHRVLSLAEPAAVNPTHHIPLIAVVGPTASGKSDLGIALAERFNGEIVNCDSVQVYRGIYVATAKVPMEERRGI